MKSSHVRSPQPWSQSRSLNAPAELLGHIIQIASTLSDCLRNPLPGYCFLRVCLAPKTHCSPIDIFWTFTTGSVYNTTFKLLFLAAQSYTVYLMLNDYKPTHDPNIDTFKVQYLLGGSAVLAVLFPYRYQVTEVSSTLCSTVSRW